MEMRQTRMFVSTRYWSMCVLLKYGLTVGFILVLVKSFMLQVLERSFWEQKAKDQSEISLDVPTYRGSIYDDQGRLLAYSVPQPSLYADGGQMDDETLNAAPGLLAGILDERQGDLQKKLVREKRFIWIKRCLTDQQASAVKKLNLKGFHFITEYKRFYPHRQLAGQLLGFVGLDGLGLEGIEKSYDAFLKETPRSIEQFRDGGRNRAWLEPCSLPEPAELSSLRLTVDSYIQYVAESELEKTATQYKAKAGQVVVLDAETSGILAIANWPPFDPNRIDDMDSHSWSNHAVADVFEPGSTFKVFMVAAGLEEKAISGRERIFCENGKCKLAGHVINDTHPHGWLTVPEVIKYSSNIGAAKLVQPLGSERYYKYIRAFGFGDPLNLDLPGESRGLVRPWKKWRPIDLVTASFGQSLGVTALQLGAGMACIANGGIYNHPSIVKDMVDSTGERVTPPPEEPPRRVVSAKTARTVTDMMLLVTQEGGTGVSAAAPGYLVAGKTGTAQMVDPETRRYSTSKYTSIFTGFVPADRPRLVITVVIHEPKGAIYGGVVAAPVFRGVASQALPYLKVPANGGDAPPAPGFRVVKATIEKREASAGPRSSAPAKVEATEGATGVEATLSENGAGQMPDLVGLGLKSALQRLSHLNVRTKCKGSGRVVVQNPPPGTLLEADSVVDLALKE